MTAAGSSSRGVADDAARPRAGTDSNPAALTPARPAASTTELKPFRGTRDASAAEPELSFVIPCLNEAKTVGPCVEAAVRCLRENNIDGEVVVGDNGSTDGSQDIARAAGARVVPVPVRGYGAAIRGGIAAARGKYIIMGDSDGQHDFAACFPFVEKLREGYDVVVGSRTKGMAMEGAMTWKSRYIGTPVITLVGKLLFATPFSDFNCGLRGFTKASFELMHPRASGMEFASEHIVKASLLARRGRLKLTEIPITVHPDGRDRPPHLRPWRDGWRHLRFMLLLSPRWTIAAPSMVMLLAGLMITLLVAAGPITIGGYMLDVHSLIAGCLFVLLGYSGLIAAVAARLYALHEEIGPPDRFLERLSSLYTLERGILAGAGFALLGAVLIGWLTYRAFLGEGLPADQVTRSLRPMIIGSTLVAMGVQTVLMSFFLSMLRIPNERRA